jgi:hypothetical protein
MAATIATPALTQSQSKKQAWYGGGYGGLLCDVAALDTDCSSSPASSPAASYESFKYHSGSEPQIIDHGDEVEVRGVAPTGEEMCAFFFRTKKSCLQHAAEVRKQQKDEEKQEQEKLDPYR